MNEEIQVMRKPGELELFSWGFIQPLSTDDAESCEIKFMTANAKAETVFENHFIKMQFIQAGV